MTVLMDVCEETAIDICAKGGMGAVIVSCICWIWDSMDFWVVSN